MVSLPFNQWRNMAYQNTEPQSNDTEPVLLAKILQLLNEIKVILQNIDNDNP